MSVLTPTLVFGTDIPSADWSSGVLNLSSLPLSELICYYSSDPEYTSGQEVTNGTTIDNQAGTSTTAVINNLVPSSTYWFVIIDPTTETANGMFTLDIPPARVVCTTSTITANTTCSFRALIDNTTISNTDTAWLSQLNVVRAVTSNQRIDIRRNEGIYFLARLETVKQRVLLPSEITSVNYTIYEKGANLFQEVEAIVTGHNNVSVNKMPACLKIPVVDYNWTTDTIGYNFVHTPSTKNFDPFPHCGHYLVVYTFVFETEEKLQLKYIVYIRD